MNDGFFLTNFNGLQNNKKAEKDVIIEIKPLNSVTNIENKKKNKEIIIKKESLKEIKIKKVINKEIKRKVKTRNTSSKATPKTKSNCVQPIVIENILFNNEKSMKDVEEEFKSQNRMLVSQNDELNSSINNRKKKLQSLDSQISTFLLNNEKLVSKDVFEFFERKKEEIDLDIIEAEKAHIQCKNMQKNLKLEKNRLRSQIIHILHLDSKYDHHQDVYQAIKLDTKISNKNKKMAQEELIRYYNEIETINQQSLDNKNKYLENLENEVNIIKENIKEQDEKMNEFEMVKKQLTKRIKIIIDKNDSIKRDLVFLKRCYITDYIQILKLQYFKLPKEFRLAEDNIENVIKLFITNQIEFNGKVSIIGVKNNEMKEKRDDLHKLKDELDSLNQQIKFKIEEKELIPNNQEISKIEENLKKIHFRNASSQNSFKDKHQFMISFLQFLSNSTIKISQIFERPRRSKFLSNLRNFCTIGTIYEENDKYKLHKEIDELNIFLTKAIHFDFELMNLILKLTLKFSQIFLEFHSYKILHFMKSIDQTNTNYNKIICLNENDDKNQMHIDEPFISKRLHSKKKISSNKEENVHHSNRYFHQLKRKNGISSENLVNFRTNYESSHRKAEKIDTAILDDSYRSENENIKDFKKKGNHKHQRFMDYNLTQELKMFYQRLNDLNKLKLLRNKEKNTEKTQKISDIIENAHNKVSKKMFNSNSIATMRKTNKSKNEQNSRENSIFEKEKSINFAKTSRMRNNVNREDKILLPEVENKKKLIKDGFLKGLFSDIFLQENEEEIQKHLKNSKSRSELSSMSTLYHSRKTSFYQSSISTINYKKPTFPLYKINKADNDII